MCCKIRTILAFPFALIGYILIIPTLFICKIACIIKGKDWPLMYSLKGVENDEETEA